MDRRASLLLAMVFVALDCSALAVPSPLIVKGRVFCDACASGHFTKSSFYLAGAKVGVQCGSRQARGHVTTYAEGKTDRNGEFLVPVSGEHEEDFCVALILHSPHPTCNVLSQRGSFATVFLSRNAGLADNVINTGPFAFVPNRISAHCVFEVASEKVNTSDGE